MKKIHLTLTALCFCALSTFGQVKFKLTRQLDRQTYVVSMISEKTYEGTDNITGTAQVTLKIGSFNNFVFRDLSSLQPETIWVNNATVSKHELSPEFMYLSFGMQTMAHNQFKYIKDKEIPLFSFKNVGDSKVTVSLLNNEEDIMAKSVQKTKYNIKNYISILGHGPGNAYLANVEPVPMSPQESMNTYLQIKNIYPNPITTNNKVVVSWENQLEDAENIEKLALLIFDNTGLEKMRIDASTNYGLQSQEISLNNYKAGPYFFKLERDGLYSTISYKLMVLE